MPYLGRVRINSGLDAAVHDALVVDSTPWLCAVSGFLAGIVSTAGLPVLLFYHACILQPAATLSKLPNDSAYPSSIYPACAIGITEGHGLMLLLWPYLFGIIAAAYGYIRHLDLSGFLRWHWKPAVRPFHVLALVTGYTAYLFICYVANSYLPITGAPLLAIASGPVLVLCWQFLHNRFLYYISKPSWENLVPGTVRVWFPRRLGVNKDDIISVKAFTNGTLELCTRFSPAVTEQAQIIGTALPGISKVLVYDTAGRHIEATTQSRALTASVEAGRIVAQLRRERERMYATHGYVERHDTVTDYSGRLLLVTASAITFSIVLALFWVSLRGGFKVLTAEDLQWFFGKYGTPAAAGGSAVPKN